VPRAGGGSGDLIVTIDIVVPRPSELSAKARLALQQLAQEDQSDPRSVLVDQMEDGAP
jgi:molecular chaperone DnaJ